MTFRSAMAAMVLVAVACSAQVDDTSYAAPDIPKDVVWLDQGAPVPHSLKQYRGRVVLIDFWEYTCINCIRDFAVVKRWYRKYHPYGFEVIGVHYGEFRMGFDPTNVQRAAERFRLPWPIVADVKSATWQAFHSNVWPNRYLIDARGSVVLQVEGEGNNQLMERRIRDLLAKEHPQVKNLPLDAEDPAFAPQCGVPTQETYVGKWFGRGAIENSSGYRHTGVEQVFTAEKPAKDGGVKLAGRWLVSQESALAAADASAELKYHARSVYAVAGAVCPPAGSANAVSCSIRVDVEQDGEPLAKQDAGADVRFDARGAYVEVNEPRMYYLVKNSPGNNPGKGKLPSHVLKLKAASPVFALNSFTFGNNCQQEDRP